MIEKSLGRNSYKIKDFNEIEAVQMFKYYCHLENIIAIELSIAKFNFDPETIVDMDNCVLNGLPFFHNTEN